MQVGREYAMYKSDADWAKAVVWKASKSESSYMLVAYGGDSRSVFIAVFFSPR